MVVLPVIRWLESPQRKGRLGLPVVLDFNGCFGDLRCITTINLPQAGKNAAPAIAATAKGGFVRTADFQLI